jgi:hypothetical protein
MVSETFFSVIGDFENAANGVFQKEKKTLT